MAATKAIIFDYDGVLIDSFPVSVLAYNEFCRRNGKRERSADEFKKLFDTDWRVGLARIGFKNKKDQEAMSKLFFEFMDEHSGSITMHDGMKDVLDTLKGKYKLAIVSNNYEQVMTKKLEEFGILDHFDCIIDIEHGEKPDPLQVFKCMEILGVKPHETVMVGDMEGDIEAAKRAKLKKAIAVSFGFHHSAQLKDADIIVNSPRELLEAIE